MIEKNTNEEKEITIQKSDENNEHIQSKSEEKNNNDEIKQLKSIKKMSIVALVMLFLIITAFVTIILELICGIKILTINWKNKEIKNSALLWGILTLILLGPIASLIFSINGLKIIGSK